jgi:hypothetical protein
LAEPRTRIWTPAEDALLNSVSSYTEYTERGGTRSGPSCATRRHHLKSQGVEVPEWARGGHASWAKEKAAVGMIEPTGEPVLELPERDGLPIDRY